jgi:hypothetical protein
MTTSVSAAPLPDIVTTHRAERGRRPSGVSMMLAIKGKTGKNGIAQAMEVASLLLRGPGKPNYTEYFAFQLYDDDLHTPEAKREFLSDNLHWPICDRCSDPHWRAITEDKWLAYALLERAGTPVPDTLAVVDRSQRTFGSTHKIAGAAELAAFLDKATYPLFAKPNGELCSLGVFTITCFANGRVTLNCGRQLTADELYENIFGDRTYLLQAVVRNHPDIARFARHVPTVRTMNLVWPDRIETPFVLFKIPVGDNVADNYWRAGNLIADLDPATGVLRRVVSGKGSDLKVHETHPETGDRLLGMCLPMWSELLAVNEACARAFAPVRYQSLDIALTPDGPCVIEINSGGSFFLPQIASGRGFLVPEVRRFFEYCGWRVK